MRNLEDDTAPTKKGTRWGRSIVGDPSRPSPHASAQPREPLPSAPARQVHAGLLHICVEMGRPDGTPVVFLHGWLDVDNAILGGLEWGSRTVSFMTAFWSECCLAIVAASGYLVAYVQLNRAPLPPTAAVLDIDRLVP